RRGLRSIDLSLARLAANELSARRGGYDARCSASTASIDLPLPLALPIAWLGAGLRPAPTLPNQAAGSWLRHLHGGEGRITQAAAPGAGGQPVRIPIN